MKPITTILLIIPFFCCSQTNMDSLWEVWNDKSLPDTARLHAMKKISWNGYLFSQPDSAFYFAQIQYDLAQSKGLKKEMADALNIQGISFAIRANYFKAIDFFTQSLKIKEEIGDRSGVANLLNNIGIIYEDQGDFEKAISYYSRSIEIQEQIGNKKGLADAFNNIGNSYYNLEDYEKALTYHARSLKIKEENGNLKGTSESLNNIGLVYSKKGENAKAMNYFDRSLKIKEKIGDQQGIASSLNNIGLLYQQQGDYSQALEYSNRALKIAKESDLVIQIQNAASTLWETNKKAGNYQKSMEMYELYVQMRDSIQSEENKKEVIRQEYKYQYEKQAAADSIKTAQAASLKDAELVAEKEENRRHQIEAKQQRQQKYFLYGGLILALILGGFIFNRFRVTRKQKGVIEKQKHKVDLAYEQLDEKNQEILDSINYAKRIQSAILPSHKLIKEYLPESFILYKPKDIVAGDFYWMEHARDQILFAAADCTGHGVPGAMVSVVCNNGLNRSVLEHGLTKPSKILDKTREIIISEFEKSEEEVKDGMDIALCALHSPSHSQSVLQYAGAHNPLWIIRRGATEVEEIKADKQPIGKFGLEQPFTNHTIELQKGDSIYIFSDGFADQFGGEKGKKFKTKNLKKLLLSIQNESMDHQKKQLNNVLENWKGDMEQLDDICVIGVKV